MLVPGSRRLCRVGLAAVLVTALCALAFLDLPPELPEPRPEPPPTLGDGGEPPGTRSVVAYSWARRLALDYRPSAECPGDDKKIFEKDFPDLLNPPATDWLETLDGRLFLFSAHLDERVPGYHAVRVIGVRPQVMDNTQVYCTIWHDDAGRLRSLSMEALIADIWLEHWGGGVSESYTGVLITCPLPTRSSEFRPLRAAVTSSPCNGDYPSHSIEVSSRLRRREDLPKVRRRGKSPRGKFNLCIKGLDFDEDISERLVAFVQLNLILGADKFYFYVFNVHENVLKALKFFETSNVVRWRNLTLPGGLTNVPPERRKLLEEDVWLKRRLELVPYNHCFYESIGESEYVLPIDIDESIVPKNGWDWGKLMYEEKIRLGKSFEDFASYAARNAHFFTEIQQHDGAIKPRYPYLDTTRSAYISPEGDSVKSFISTRRTLTVHNHYALATLDSVTRRAHHFRPQDVLKHHHRFCDSKYLDCDILRRDVVSDYSAIRFTEKLYRRTRAVLANLTNS